MDLGNERESKNFDDVRFQQTRDHILRALIRNYDPYSQVQGGTGPAANSYGKFLQGWLNSLSPDEIQALKNGANYNDIIYARALKNNPNFYNESTDWQFRNLYSKRK